MALQSESNTPDNNLAIKNNVGAIPFKTRARPYFIVAPALIVTIGIMIPFVMAIYYSLTSYAFSRPTFDFVWFRNWIRMFENPDFWHAVWVTVRYAFFSTGIELLLGLGIAMLLSNVDNRFSKILRVGVVFPLMIAPVMATIIWQLMLNNSVGIVEKFLNLFGIFNFPWAAAHETAMMTAVMIDVWVNCPFVIVLILAGIQSLPKSPFESAKIDGGSAWFNFRKLTLPILKPNILIALLFRLMASLQEFSIIFALTKGGPGNTLMNLSVTAYNTGFQFNRFGQALPFILFLWLIINFVAKRIVNQWQSATNQATGKSEEGKVSKRDVRKKALKDM